MAKKTDEKTTVKGDSKTVKKAPKSPRKPRQLKSGAKERKSKEKKANNNSISIEKYNEMVDAFFEVQTVNHVSKVCGVHFQTAKRYIDKGDPTRGLTAIRLRFEAALQTYQKKQDRSWVEARDESIRLVQRTKLEIAKILKDIDSTKVKITDIQGLKTLGDTVDKLTRLEAFCFGEADSRSEMKVEDKFEGWSVEEKMEFIKTGKRPDRLLATLSGGIREDD